MILNTQQIKSAEQKAFEKYFTEEELMYAAGKACFEKIIKYYSAQIINAPVAVVCGNGKNAGDGFVIAELLHNYGSQVTIVLVDKSPTQTEPLKFFNDAVDAGVNWVSIGETDLAKAGYSLIVDCIFGIGFHGEAVKPFSDAFNAINDSGAVVVAVDTPSGTDATTGEAVNAVKANLTIAISTLKFAHILPPSNDYCGKTVVVNIGIPKDCFDDIYVQTISKSYVKSCFSVPNKNANKGTFGRLALICGSYAMPGAAVMCAKGALKTGAGLVQCIFPKSIYSVLTSHLYQPIFCPVTENEQKTISMGALTTVLENAEKASAVVIGCGMGVNDDTQVVLNQVLRECKTPILIDADGINCLASSIDILQDINIPVILTPHPGEMARLTAKTVEEIQQNRIDIAVSFAKKQNVILVLKGANTIVTNGKEVFVNTNGNTGMAMAGCGDLLSGIIGSLCAQGINAFDAAKCGVFIHGMCGDVAASELSKRGMTTDNMAELLGALMSEFE